MDTTEQLDKPVALNYLVMPHVPKDVGTLLSNEGEPQMVNFNQVDWKGLAHSLEYRLKEAGFPKAIKVYVANDGLDLFDVNDIVVNQQNPNIRSDSWFERIALALDEVDKRQYRAGILNWGEAGESLHLNPLNPENKRGPIAGIVVSIRFPTMFHLTDYSCAAAREVFGVMLALEPHASGHGSAEEPMCPELRQWLRDNNGVVYADQCSLVNVNATFFR